MGLGPRGADSVLVFLSDTINPHPRPPVPLRPIGPQPDIAVLVLVEGVGAQVGRHQPLKLIALIAGIGRRAGEIVQDSVDRGGHWLSLFLRFVWRCQFGSQWWYYDPLDNMSPYPSALLFVRAPASTLGSRLLPLTKTFVFCVRQRPLGIRVTKPGCDTLLTVAIWINGVSIC